MDHAIGTDYTEETRGPWRTGEPAIYPLPDNEKSWEVCNKLVQDTDKSQYKVWKDDIDKMLVFVSIYYQISIQLLASVVLMKY